jgi:hypothetical protein
VDGGRCLETADLKKAWLGQLGATAFAAGGAGAPAPSSSAVIGGGGGRPAEFARRIAAKVEQGSDLGAELRTMSHMDMKSLLDIAERLKKSGKLEAFADHVTGEYRRVGVAILTARPDLDAQWQSLVAGLSAADREAVLGRGPPGAKLSADGPASGSSQPAKDDAAVASGAVIAAGASGAEVQATLTFHSKVAGNLGETQFTVHIGPDGKLSQFELDITALTERLEKLGALSSMLELEATLSLNSAVDLDQQASKVIFGNVQAQVKGEIEMHLRDIRPLEKVAFKLTATAGSGGFSVTGSIEAAIPGT